MEQTLELCMAGLRVQLYDVVGSDVVGSLGDGVDLPVNAMVLESGLSIAAPSSCDLNIRRSEAGTCQANSKETSWNATD